MKDQVCTLSFALAQTIPLPHTNSYRPNGLDNFPFCLYLFLGQNL
jgi:hypothetical protein